MSVPLTVDSLVAVVAHRALLADRLPSYLSLLIENGFSLLYQTHLLLTDDHTPLLLGQSVEDDEVVFAPSTPACVLHVQRVAAYATFDRLREQLDFVYGSNSQWTALRDLQMFFPSTVALERGLLVLKPGYTQSDYAEVMDALEANGFITLDLMGKILSADEAAQLCGDDKAELSSFTSDISVFVAVERVNASALLTLLVGPDSPSLARTIAPASLRARLTSSLYCSASPQRAAEVGRICWPDGFRLQRTVLVLGGPAVEAEPRMTLRLEEEGFTVIRREAIYLSRARLEKLWKGRLGSATSDLLLTQWAAAPSIAFLLTKAAAISHCRVVVDSLRSHEFIFASTAESAAEDARDVFPLIPPAPASLSSQEVLDRFTAPLPTPTPSTAPSTLQSVLTRALIELCKAKPAADEAVTWLAQWLLQHNPNAPVISGPQVTEAEDDAASGGARPQGMKSVWAVGEGLEGVVADLVHSQGFVHIDVTALLSAAVVNNAEVGLALSEYVQTDRATPSALLLPLIQSALTAGQSRPSRVVLTGFPRDLDQAFAYEEGVGAVSVILVEREREERKRSVDEGVESVLEHYRGFRKLMEVQTSGEEKATTAAVQRALYSIEA